MTTNRQAFERQIALLKAQALLIGNASTGVILRGSTSFQMQMIASEIGELIVEAFDYNPFVGREMDAWNDAERECERIYFSSQDDRPMYPPLRDRVEPWG